MRVALAVRAAVLILLGGLLMALAAVAPARPEPGPVTTWRPATEEERRQSDRELLIEEMDRLWPTPTVVPAS